MRKICAIISILLFCCVFFAPVTAFANSAQRKFEGVSSNGALVTDTNCPIQVTSERLTFNITDFPIVYNEQTVYNSNVVAEYSFYNPSDYNVNMQLVFPFGMIPYWAHADYIDASKYAVYVDGVEIVRDIRAVYCPYDKPFNLSEDLPKIADGRNSFTYLSDGTTVYKYTVKSQFEHDYEIALSPYAIFDTDGLTLLIDTESYFVNQGSQYNKSTKIYDTDEAVIYSVGRRLPDSFFSPTYHVEVCEHINGNAVYSEKTIQGVTNYQYLGEETFEDVVFYYYKEQSGVLRDDYYNAVIDKLGENKYFSAGSYYMADLDVSRNLMLWYQYDVSVPSKQTVVNKVIAPTYPTVDYSYTPAKYHYEYLLSPASSWASFANLDVTINAGYYMLDPSLKGFVKNEDGAYKAHFDELPQGELSFILCESENPKYDNSYSTFIILLIVFLFVLPVVGVLLITAAIVIPIVVCKRRKRKQQDLLQPDPVCPLKQKEEAMTDFFTKN